MSRYADIIERLEKAEGPDREFDLDIARATVPDVICLRHNRETGQNEPFVHWQYTASLDAAISLVERMLPKIEYTLGNRHPAAPPYRPYYGEIFLDGEPHVEFGVNNSIAILLALFRTLEAQEATT